jgi:hypothetical protein
MRAPREVAFIIPMRQDARHVSLRGEEAVGVQGPWDYDKLIATIPGEQAFKPMDQGNCPMVSKKN